MSANIQDFNIQDIEVLTQSFANLMPSGKAFEAKNIPDSEMRKLLTGFSQETRRATAALYVLASQFIPNLNDSYIEIWEKFLGIPDTCIPINLTDEQRRLNIIIKLAYLNLYSIEDYYSLAELLGVEIVSHDNSAYGYLGINILNNPESTFPQLFDPIVEVTYGAFIFGNESQSIFECLVKKYKPSHVDVVFGTIESTFQFSFINHGIIPTEMSFSRSSIGTAINSNKFIETYAIDTPRFNYDISTGNSLGLLIEGSFTNISNHSSDINNWDQFNNVTIIPNSTNSPAISDLSVIYQSDILNKDAGGAGNRVEIDTTIVNGTSYKVSILIKNISTNGNARLSFGNDIEILYNYGTNLLSVEDGSPTNLNVVDYNNDWYLISFDIVATNDSDFNVFISRDGTATEDTQISLYGLQITEELKAISYIETVDSAVTMSRDILTLDTTDIFSATDGTILLHHNIVSGDPLLDGLLDSSGPGKTLIKWNATESKIYSNGSLISTGSPLTIPSTIELFVDNTGLRYSFGNLTYIKCYNIEVSDLDAISVTT